MGTERDMIYRRLVFALVVGTVTGLISAIVITIIDIYLSGHGNEGLTREYLTWSAASVHLSIGDIIMLSTALLGATLTWSHYGRDA